MEELPLVPPLDYQPRGIPTRRQRPTSVNILGVLGIVFGGVSVICTPISLLPYFIDLAKPHPVVDAIKAHPTARWHFAGMAAASLVMGICLLAGSIGVLYLRNWARQLVSIFAVGAIAVQVWGIILQAVLMKPIMQQAITNAPPEFKNNIPVASPVNLITGLLIGMVFPIAILYFMNHRDVKSAFARGPI